MAVPSVKEIMDYSPLNTGGKEDVPQFKRNLYHEIDGMMGKRFCIAITGLRRVGKSVMVKQLLNKHGGFYFSFDEQRYRNIESLGAVIDTFLDHGAKTIALDEIGYVEGWAGTIKKYYDRKEIKFLLTGSSSLKVKKGKESLAGRMFDFHLPTLQFDEYLAMGGIQVPEKLWNMHPENERLGGFLMSGSFPEIHDEPQETVRKYVSSVAEKIMFEDIPSVWNVHHKSKLFDLFRYIVSFSGSQFSESSVSNTLGLSRGAVGDYTAYLSQAYLVSLLNEAGSFARALQKTRKAYVNCATLYRSFADSYSEGSEAEVAAFDRICGWKCRDETRFFRDYQKREVDFVVGKLPIEVKFRSYIKEEDFGNLLYLMKKGGEEKGIIVTKDAFDVRKFGDKRVLMIPLSVFLSCRGREMVAGF